MANLTPHPRNPPTANGHHTTMTGNHTYVYLITHRDLQLAKIGISHQTRGLNRANAWRGHGWHINHIWHMPDRRSCHAAETAVLKHWRANGHTIPARAHTHTAGIGQGEGHAEMVELQALDQAAVAAIVEQHRPHMSFPWTPITFRARRYGTMHHIVPTSMGGRPPCGARPTADIHWQPVTTFTAGEEARDLDLCAVCARVAGITELAGTRRAAAASNT